MEMLKLSCIYKILSHIYEIVSRIFDLILNEFWQLKAFVLFTNFLRKNHFLERSLRTKKNLHVQECLNS